MVLLSDVVLDPGQKTPEHASSRLGAAAEASESLSHEPTTPGKHRPPVHCGSPPASTRLARKRAGMRTRGQSLTWHVYRHGMG